MLPAASQISVKFRRSSNRAFRLSVDALARITPFTVLSSPLPVIGTVISINRPLT
jgi:hypothetical protein